MRHNHKMAKRLLLRLVILSLALFVITFSIVAVLYSNHHAYQVTRTAYDYAKMAADYIDGDTISHYVETLEKDAYYFKVEALLNAVLAQRFSDIRFYYVYVPCEDDYIYVWDAYNYNNEDAAELGERESYMKGAKEATIRAFQSDPKERLTVVNDDVYGSVASAYYPVLNSQGEPVAVVAVDLMIDKLRAERSSTLLRIFLLILFIVGLFSTVIYFWFVRQVVIPVVRLKKGMQIYRRNMNSDEATLALDKMHLTNEIGALTGGFISLMVATDINTAKVAKLTAEQEHISAELNIATKMQADMLPCVFPAFPERKEFELYASMHPAKEVGGDFYDFFLIDDDHLALVMADVSGKGIPAALFMVITRTLIKNRALICGTPSEILADVNTQLCLENKSGMFVTVWLAILEISTGKGLAANAGHENPVIRRAGGSYELVEYRHSPVLAFMKGIRYEEHPFQLNPGDRLFVYTDGVPEATNSASELFGCERMVDVLNAAGDLSARETLQDLKRSIDAFVGSAPQFDDITMLCLDYYGAAAAPSPSAQGPDQAAEALSASKKGEMEP